MTEVKMSKVQMTKFRCQYNFPQDIEKIAVDTGFRDSNNVLIDHLQYLQLKL